MEGGSDYTRQSIGKKDQILYQKFRSIFHQAILSFEASSLRKEENYPATTARSPQDGPVGSEVLQQFGDVFGVVLPGRGVPLVHGARLVRRHQTLQERNLWFMMYVMPNLTQDNEL